MSNQLKENVMSRTFKDVPRRALKSGYEESHYGCQFDTSFNNQGGRIVGITNHPAKYATEPEWHDVEYLVRPDGCAHPIDRVRVEDISSSKAYFLEFVHKFTRVSVREYSPRLLSEAWVEYKIEVFECDINSPGGRCYKWRYQDYYSNKWFNTKSVRSNDRDTFLDMVKEYNSTGEVTSVEDEIHWYN